MEIKIGKATFWSSITEILSKLISPIVNMVLARLLAPEQFGIIATINMVISFAEVFTDAGFQKYIVQREFESKEELEKSTNVAFWTNLMFSTLACVVIFIFRHQIAILVGNAGLGNAISIGSVAILIVAFSSIQMARYRRDFDFKTLFFVRIGTSIIPLVVTVPLAIILRDYRAILVGSLLTHIFNAVILTWKSKWKPCFFYSFGLLKKMFSFSVWSLFEHISIWLVAYLDLFIVGKMLSSYYLGIYKTAMTTVNSYMSIITAAIIPVAFSALSRHQNNEVSFKKIYFSFQRITAIIVFPMGFGIWIFRDFVTDILLGTQWKEASNFIGLWGFSKAWSIVLSNFVSEVFRSKGKPKISLLFQLIHLTFLIPTVLISVKYGYEVLYIARTAITFQMVLSAFCFMRILYKFKIVETLRNIFPIVFASMIMAVIAYVLKFLLNSMLWNIFVIIISVAVYAAVLKFLCPKTWYELMHWLKKKDKDEVK